MSVTKRHLAAALALVGALAVNADDHSATSASNVDCPVDAAMLPDSSRVVVAGGSITEIIYRLGAEGQLVAVDSTSNYPAAATELPQIGYVRSLSTEGVLTLDPTLILGEHDMGPPEVIEQLEQTGIRTAVLPEAFTADGIISKVRCVALAVDKVDAGEALVAELLAIDGSPAVESTPPRVAVLLGLREGSPVGAGANTSGDGLIAMAGGANVLASFEGWKPLSLEAMIDANPDVIVMPNRGVAMAGGLDAVLEHPAIRLTTAGQERRVIAMDGMTLLGFGPRTLTAASDLARQLHADTPE